MLGRSVWASPDHGWLRKYYPAGSDDARFDLAPTVEKALRWVRDLPGREFIGTESCLNIIFDLLRQMVFGADDDPERRLAELGLLARSEPPVDPG